MLALVGKAFSMRLGKEGSQGMKRWLTFTNLEQSEESRLKKTALLIAAGFGANPVIHFLEQTAQSDTSAVSLVLTVPLFNFFHRASQAQQQTTDAGSVPRNLGKSDSMGSHAQVSTMLST